MRWREIIQAHASDRFYHGTTTLHSPAIEREGLRPQSETPSALRGNESTIPGWTEGNVYLTPDLQTAVRYARMQVEAQGGEPVVYFVRVPDESRLVPDDEYILLHARRQHPEWATGGARWLRAGQLDPAHIAEAARHDWRASLRLDTPVVGYRGTIPPASLTRLPLADEDETMHLFFRGTLPKREAR